MHLDRRFLVIVGTSLAWGLIVSLVFYRMATAGRRQVPEKPLIVASEPLSPGTAIEARTLKTVRVPVSLFPKGGYSKVEDVVGRPVISSVRPDEPVVESRLAARGLAIRRSAHDPHRNEGGIGAGKRCGRCRRVCAAGYARGRPGNRQIGRKG